MLLFHLDHARYRGIQEEGLQSKYNETGDRGIKQDTHMLWAIFLYRLAM